MSDNKENEKEDNTKEKIKALTYKLQYDIEVSVEGYFGGEGSYLMSDEQ